MISGQAFVISGQALVISGQAAPRIRALDGLWRARLSLKGPESRVYKDLKADGAARWQASGGIAPALMCAGGPFAWPPGFGPGGALRSRFTGRLGAALAAAGGF